MKTLESGIKNAKNTVRYIFGKGSVSQLDSLLDDFRDDEKSYAIYFIDKYFNKNLEPLKGLLSSDIDIMKFVDTKHEPKTDAIDLLVSELQQEGKGAPFAVIGIGGGSVSLLTIKAVKKLKNIPKVPIPSGEIPNNQFSAKLVEGLINLK